jgi:transposase InsO family protein
MTTVSLAAIREPARQAGYPMHKTTLIERLAREGALRVEEMAARGQRGFLYDIATLPAAIRAGLSPSAASGNASLQPYLTAPPSQRVEAERRLSMVRRFKHLRENGCSPAAARATVAAESNCSEPTVKRAWKLVRNAVESEWLALLVKNYRGAAPAPIAPEILSYFYSDYGRVEQPKLQAVYERTVKKAAHNGWGPVPCAKTLQRRWNALPKAQRVLLRQGDDALDRMFPYAERDRTGMKPLDGINLDCRKWDILVTWPDGRELRPTVVMVQDEATNYLLGWIVGETESGDMYRRALCDVFTKFGIPKRALFDNTRAAANKMLTAGAEGRNRFKDKSSDPMGILPLIGCKPTFAQPYNGQSKLVERAFGEIKERSEKDPRLAGAYTGRSPSEKPANYGEKAVPLDLFKAVLAEAVEHYNSRTDRRGKVAYRTSHRALFEQGLSETKINRLTDAQRRYFFLAAERRTVTPDGSVKLGKEPHINRYWSAALADHAGTSVFVRYDPDHLAAPVMVETAEGSLIDDAVTIVEKRGFNSAADAREHQRAKRAFIKREKQNAAELVKMAACERGGYDMPAPDTSPAPAAPVIAPNFTAKVPRVRKGVDWDAIERGTAKEHRSRYG